MIQLWPWAAIRGLQGRLADAQASNAYLIDRCADLLREIDALKARDPCSMPENEAFVERIGGVW